MMVTAEQQLLGAVLERNEIYLDAIKFVSGTDFSEPRLGGVWDGMVGHLSHGGALTVTTVANHFAEWGVHGVTIVEPFEWETAANGEYRYAAEFAKSIARSSAARFAKELAQDTLNKVNDPGYDPESLLSEISVRIADRETRDAPIEFISAHDLLERDEPYDWVIPDLMERRDRLILTGGEGVGKSTMLRQLIMLPAAGLHPFTFEKIDPVRILVVDTENSQTQWARATKYVRHQATIQGVSDPFDNIKLSLEGGNINILDPRTMSEIQKKISEIRPDLLLIGPLYKLAPEAESEREVMKVIRALDSIRDRGVAMIMEGHSGHGTDQAGNRSVRPRGSSAWMGWPEFGLGIRSSADYAGAFELVPWRGGRERRDWPELIVAGNESRAEFPWVPHYL